MSAPPAISLSNVHRHFGDLHAVQGISFDIAAGQVVGFIGANGAGKTTTMRMMATLDLPDCGTISICGIDAVNHPFDVRHRVGWMPDAYESYPDMTVGDYLDFFARAFGYRGTERRQRIAQVMDFTELGRLAERPMNTLSKGMGQRLCLGRTLIHDPPVLILDEPAAGLDPKARVEFKHLVRLLAEEGKTVFISSHILSELGEMCDFLVFIDEGRVMHQGSAASLARHGETGIALAVEVFGNPASLEQWISLQPGLSRLESRKNGCLLRLENDDPEFLTATLKRMLNEGLPVTSFHKEERKLEDAFISLLQKIEVKRPTFSSHRPPLKPAS